jgi:hypothetical protein
VKKVSEGTAIPLPVMGMGSNADDEPVSYTQRVSSLGPKGIAKVPAGNVDGEWTHDLHTSVASATAIGSGSFASRVSAPGASSNDLNNRKQTKRTAKITSVLSKRADLAAQLDEEVAQLAEERETYNIQQRQQPSQQKTNNMGLSIRGLAGPFAVRALNFAPGTTAADVESAMTPVGGEILSCIVVKTVPVLVVEMVFASREGGEAVIATFNNQTVRASCDSVPSAVSFVRSCSLHIAFFCLTCSRH